VVVKRVSSGHWMAMVEAANLEVGLAEELEVAVEESMVPMAAIPGSLVGYPKVHWACLVAAFHPKETLEDLEGPMDLDYWDNRHSDNRLGHLHILHHTLHHSRRRRPHLDRIYYFLSFPGQQFVEVEVVAVAGFEDSVLELEQEKGARMEEKTVTALFFAHGVFVAILEEMIASQERSVAVLVTSCPRI
jgi:hypothetical protein